MLIILEISLRLWYYLCRSLLKAGLEIEQNNLVKMTRLSAGVAKW